LTCWKWMAMMMLRFRQQNCVDGDGSWWQFLWPFLWFWFVHSTGILHRIGTKHEMLVSQENPLEKNLSIVISFVVWRWDSNSKKRVCWLMHKKVRLADLDLGPVVLSILILKKSFRKGENYGSLWKMWIFTWFCLVKKW
jgi:hypothetical protein